MTLWTIGLQVPLTMGFSKQEYWSGLPFSSPRDLLDPRIEPTVVSDCLQPHKEIYLGFSGGEKEATSELKSADSKPVVFFFK